MKRKMWILVIIAVVLVAAGIGIAVSVYNNQPVTEPGIHSYEKKMTIALSEPCYIYDQQQGIFVDNATIVCNTEIEMDPGWMDQKSYIKGSVFSDQQSFFVEGYQIPEDGVFFFNGSSTYIKSESSEKLILRGTGSKFVSDPSGEGYQDIGDRYGEYDLKSEKLVVQLTSYDSQWLVALAGFDSQKAAEEYLQTDGKQWLQKRYTADLKEAHEGSN